MGEEEEEAKQRLQDGNVLEEKTLRAGEMCFCCVCKA